MCFNVSITRRADEIEELFNAKFIQPELFQPIYHVSAFSKPYLPVITGAKPDAIQMFQWGLIPFWVKDKEKAEKIRFQTGNARAESIHEKPSYRSAIKKNRCLLPIDGFYEWQELRGKNYPHYIHLTDNRMFTLAGIWETWNEPDSGTLVNTFSVITTAANPMMERIHNKKKRMPVILRREDEPKWLSDSLDRQGIDALLQPYDESGMEAYTVSRLVSRRDVNNNVPEVMEPCTYPELQTKDLFSY
jgi:putative SOS response-associated peptidase YedK